MNQYLIKFVKSLEPGKALDLGCGEGFDLASLRHLGWVCEGVDLKIGVDLEKEYLSENRMFDLVYSNFVYHFIKNKSGFAKTMYLNLREGGRLFLLTFDETDNSGKGVTSGLEKIKKDELKRVLEEAGFKDVNINKHDFYDNQEGHKHWHVILEATGKK